jgi:polygalacturonase
MVQRIARARLSIALAGVLGGLALSSAEAAANCAIVKGSDEGSRPVCSTGTVVVAERPDAVKVVGTSTITVADGVTARDLRRALTAADDSRQSHLVTDADGRRVQPSRPIEEGDRFVVTAEDRRHRFSYRLAIHDPEARERDGVYWDEDVYNRVDGTVNANTPTFPARYCDVTDRRYASRVRRATETLAIGNEAGDPAAKTSPLVFDSQQVWYYGDAIAAAIRDCHERGGGIVVIPAGGSRNANGAYYSGAIELLSGVNLHVERGATVRFMRNKTNEYYPVVLTSYEGTDMYSYSPLIDAIGQRNIAVTGGGLLDGQEDMWNWRPWKKGYWGELRVEDQSTTASYGQQGVLNRMNFEDLPITKRIFSDDGQMPATIPLPDGRRVPPPADATALKSTFRPHFIETNHSSNVLIEGVTIRNTPFWIVHPLNSRNVLVRDLDIYSDKTKDFEAGGWNNDDGINPESSQNVVMERNDVTVSDDGAAIKAGRNVNGRRHRSPTDGVIIRDSSYRNDGGGSAAVSMGSEMSAGVRNVFIHDSEFGGPGLSLLLKIKTNSNRGGFVEDIYVRDSVLERAISGMVQFDANFSETVPFPNTDVFDPKIRNVFLDNVNTVPTMTPGRSTFQFSSSPSRSPVENVYYRDSVFHTSSTLEAAFSRNKNIKTFVVENVRYVDPSTQAQTRYDTTPLNVLDQTVAHAGGRDIRLTPASIASPDAITDLPERTFTISGKVDLDAYPGFVDGGTARIFVDRSGTPVPVTLRPDGSFTSDPITLGDAPPWYIDRRYVALNLFNGINMQTVVYQVTVP